MKRCRPDVADVAFGNSVTAGMQSHDARIARGEQVEMGPPMPVGGKKSPLLLGP